MNPRKRLQKIHRLLEELLENVDLGDATESTDRALDQVGYALDALPRPAGAWYDADEVTDE